MAHCFEVATGAQPDGLAVKRFGVALGGWVKKSPTPADKTI